MKILNALGGGNDVKRSRFTTGAMCAVLLLVASGRAAAQSALLNQELLKDWVSMKDTMMKLANEMPEAKYSFKTTPPQRDFGQQVLHVAAANLINLAFLRGKAAPPVIDRKATP